MVNFCHSLTQHHLVYNMVREYQFHFFTVLSEFKKLVLNVP